MQPPPPPSAPPAAPPSGAAPPPGYPAQPIAWVPPPVSRKKWWLWGCGGCAALTVVVIALIVFVFLRIFSSSPLRQFPTEAGANTTQDHFVSSGNQTTETLTIIDPHSLVDAETYYQQALHSNGWTTDTHDPTQASSGDTWTISRPASPGQTGTVTFLGAGANTDIEVTFSF